MIQAQVIQKAVAAVAEVPTALLVPPATGAAVCVAVGYTFAVGLHLVSASGGDYDPVIGALSLSSTSGNASCIAEVLPCHYLH
jgi:hypothetical protein